MSPDQATENARPSARDESAKSRVISDVEEMERVFEVGQLTLVRKAESQASHRMEVAGWIRNEAVILRGHRRLITSGHFYYQNMVVVRFINRGEAFGFRSQCVTTVKDPSLIIITWPDRVEALVLSQSRRQRVHLPASLHLPAVSDYGEERSFEVVLKDVSKMGCQVELITEFNVEQVLSPGSKTMVSFALAGEAHIDRIKAVVRNYNTSGNAVLLGVQFSDPEQDGVKQLARILDMQLAA